MRVDVASHAPHGRKHGATFAETWALHDGAIVVAVGAVLSGNDPVAVGDLLGVGVRTVLTDRKKLHDALVGLDELVTHHAREHRDDELAASLVLLAFDSDGRHVAIAGAGRLGATIVSSVGDHHTVHGRAGALGTGIEPANAVDVVPLRPDDLVVVATAPVDPAWFVDGEQSAQALVHRIDAKEASVAVITLRQAQGDAVSSA
jgi:hypothetical protein